MNLGLGLGLPAVATRGQGVPPLPAGFAYLQFDDGSYAVWPDGAYVVRYTG